MKTSFKILWILMIATSLFLSQGNCAEKKEIHKSFQLDKNGEVAIDTYKGSINISTWDKSEIDIHVTIEMDQWELNAQRKIDRTEVDFYTSSNSVRMKTDYNSLNGDLPSVHYLIKMPRTANLEVKDYKSTSKINDIEASIKFETYKGDVDIRNFNGSIDLNTYKGDVDVDFTKLAGDCEFETYKGSIDIKLPKKTGFNLEADIPKKGDLYSDFELTTKNIKKNNYKCAVNSGGPIIKLDTYKGNFKLIEN